MKHTLVAGLILGLTLCTANKAIAADGGVDELRRQNATLKKDLEDLRRRLSAQERKSGIANSPIANADVMVENKYGPNAGVTTKEGKLTMGGLVQVWFYTIQNDNFSVYNHQALVAQGGATASDGTVGFGSNEVNDNDGFAVRRAQLRFTMDIHENVTAYVMIDPAAEADSYPSLPNNQNQAARGVATFNPGVEFATDDANDPTNLFLVNVGNVRNEAVRNGSGSANRLLHDAYINYHGVIPHHDFTVGQQQAHIGEEGIRDDAHLDFVERSMISQLANDRDLGLQVHGSWWDERFQYWLGVFNGAGTAFQSTRNRANDNDEFDYVGSVLLRPLWKDETWGSIELGFGAKYGKGGESGGHLGLVNGGGALLDPVDGLNRPGTDHHLLYAYGMYKPGGPVRGWWIRGEWGSYRDRFAPGELRLPVGIDSTTGTSAPFTVQGWTINTGYKLSDSIWADGLREGGTFKKHFLLPMEFVGRYDVMDNIFTINDADVNNNGGIGLNRGQDIAKTQVITAGVNYFIKGHNAKLQFNYNWVIEESEGVDSGDGGAGVRQLREVSNNNFVVNFQVAW
ncbi:MAG: OprO/OprP family phosphate-selective porin [Planctomycetes bacterium]|nr:OprO/OprP family phosphate-selective porin [Planctomycetota bacterium]